jgi:hypothetical protein
MLNNQRLTGIGKLDFLNAEIVVLTDEYIAFCVKYIAIHGEEDKKNMPNPINEQQMINNFNEIFND